MSNIYGFNYIEHMGVKGMHWGIRKKPESSGSDRKRMKALKKATLKSYRTDKGPKRGKFLNAANSAARSHFRSERTRSFKTYRDQNSKKTLKEARLTEAQVKNGRYRVARSRSIKRNVASTVLSTAAGAAMIASGGLAVAPIAAATAVVGTTGLHFATGAHYYGRQRKAYGGTRAKYQNQKKVRKNAA